MALIKRSKSVTHPLHRATSTRTWIVFFSSLTSDEFRPSKYYHPHRPHPDVDATTAKMGRLHSNGKGISASAIPYSRNPPAWLKTTPDQVVDQICKLAKKGATPSQIGVILRDSQGIAQVKIVTGMFGCGSSARRRLYELTCVV